MSTQSWQNIGFTFAVQNKQDGTPFVTVTDTWHNRRAAQPAEEQTLTIRLRPYASYSEAREIANFINSRLSYGELPLIELCACA